MCVLASHPYSYFAGWEARFPAGKRRWRLHPAGLAQLYVFHKGGDGEVGGPQLFAGTSKLAGSPTIALLRTIGNPGWLARSVAICFWQCSKKSAGVMASWA
jgi:hypothetical protein